MGIIAFQLDVTGKNPDNLVTNEVHSITEANFNDFYFIIPQFSPFFTNNLAVIYKDNNGNTTIMQENVDYFLGLPYYGAQRAIGIPIYGAIVFSNVYTSGTVSITYQTIGGDWTNPNNFLYAALAQLGYNPLIARYDQISNVPSTFPPVAHEQPLNSVMGMDDLVQAIYTLAEIMASKTLNVQDQLLTIQNIIESNIANQISYIVGGSGVTETGGGNASLGQVLLLESQVNSLTTLVNNLNSSVSELCAVVDNLSSK